jgi:hypothetical protein
MMGGRGGRKFVRCCRGALILCALAIGSIAPAWAQEIAGTYVLLGDSDGTSPRTGAKLELTFSGGASGSVKLVAVRPGENYRDTGAYSIANRQITIHFKEVDWAANHQPYTLDGCRLTLPFMAVSAATGPGTSAWQREDPQCTGQPASMAQGRATQPKLNPFSADEVVTRSGQRRTIKVYATENALRSESQENGQDVVTIVRFDRNVVWTLTPQTRSFTETSVAFGAGSQSLQQGPAGPDCSVAGEEQVGGYHCSKLVCHMKVNGNDYTETRWAGTDKDVDGLVIKYSDGLETLELQNIKLGPPAPGLFEIPSGYQKQAGR